MESQSNLYNGEAPSLYFTLNEIDEHDELLSKTVSNIRTRIKTIGLATIGIFEIEPAGSKGAVHQLSVLSTGCSTHFIIRERGIGKDGKKRVIFNFPVLPTGSFKLECAFNNGLELAINGSQDAPPIFTLNWRVVK